MKSEISMGAAMPWIARYKDYVNCKKGIAREYGNISRSTTRLLSLFKLMEDNQFYGPLEKWLSH